MKNYEAIETIFKKCPVCKSGKVQKYKPTGFLKFTKSEIITCDKCDARFEDDSEIHIPEKKYKLDLSHSNEKNKYESQSLRVSEWERGTSDIDHCVESGSLPVANIKGLKIILLPKEQTHWYNPSVGLMEERAIRRSVGGAVRVVKGVYVGGSQSESHGELRTIDQGELLLTSQRLIFNGDFKHIEFKLDKITSVEEMEDAVEVGASNLKKVQIFVLSGPHAWTEYLKLAIRNYQKQKK